MSDCGDCDCFDGCNDVGESNSFNNSSEITADECDECCDACLCCFACCEDHSNYHSNYNFNHYSNYNRVNVSERNNSTLNNVAIKLQDNIVVNQAPKPAGISALNYKMNHKRRGIAFVFCHDEFEFKNFEKRSGVEVDCKGLAECFDELGFEIKVFRNLELEQIRFYMDEASKLDYSDYDCILITVLSYGKKDVICAKDAPYTPEYLWSQFTTDKCPTLAGKPKIFILQACQSIELDDISLQLNNTETDSNERNDGIFHGNNLQLDFLVVYLTCKDFYSWKNTVKGSWFIQSLCKELSERWRQNDLVTILTNVCGSQKASKNYESNVPYGIDKNLREEEPSILNTLTGRIDFNQVKEVDANRIGWAV